MAKYLVAVIAVFCLIGHSRVNAADFEPVPSVQQEYEETTNRLIENQIQIELTASYLYQAYASYYQRADVALPGIQKYFAEASLEERQHGQMLIDYVNMRGGHVKLNEINIFDTCKAVKIWMRSQGSEKPSCICSFLTKVKDCTKIEKKGLVGFKDALNIEKYVNKKLLELHNDTISDVHFSHMLEHHLLEEQIQSINTLGHYVTRLSSFGSNYKLGEYMFDQRLK